MNTVADSPTPRRVRPSEPAPWLWLSMWAVWGLALVVTLWLAWEGRHLAGPEAPSVGLFGCGFGASCDVVLQSPYSHILGISLTTWSFGYLLLVAAALLVSIYAWQLSLSPPLSLMLPVVVSVGLVASGWSVAVMAVALGSFCPWCLTLDGLNLALFALAVAYAWQDWHHRQYIRWQAGVPPLPIAPVAMHFVVAILLGTTQLLVMNTFHGAVTKAPLKLVAPEQSLGVNARVAGWMQTLAIDSVPASGERESRQNQVIWSIKGPRDAPHRIVVFSCLTCPICRELNGILNTISARHPGQLRIDERFFPLWHTCNDSIPAGLPEALHKDACPLARIALAVAMTEPDKFGDFVDWVYDHQSAMSETVARDEALRRVDKARFLAALDDDALWMRFREDMELGRRLKVHSVPQIFLDKGQVYGSVDAKNLEALLAAAFAWPAEQPIAGEEKKVLVNGDLILEHQSRGIEFARQGLFSDAVRELKEALRLKPDWSDVALQLSWIQSTCSDGKIRNGAEALYYARLVQQQSEKASDPPKNLPLVHDVLAAALAENGKFDEAIQEQTKAMALYFKAGLQTEANQANERLKEYRRGQPHRSD